MKVAIIGYSGSGKSTLAKFIHDKYQIPLLYLDKVQFLSNWQNRDEEEALMMVKEFMENQEWVIDGNYSRRFQKERLAEADKIIFMNFNRFNCFKRAFFRHLKYKNKCRESITDGCAEKFDLSFMTWILHGGRTKRVKRHYQNIIEEYSYKVTIIKNQKELDQFKLKLSDK